MPLRSFRRRLRGSRPSGYYRPVLESLESRYLLSTLTVLNLNDSGAGSLRQAILSANSGDTINFAVSGTIALTSGPLTISQNLTIAGPGASSLTISGNNATQVFSVGDVNFTLSGLTVANASSAGSGAGVDMFADPSTTLTLTSCVFTNDHSLAGNGGAVEIRGDGQMSVTDCTFSSCSSAGNGGVIDSPGIFLNVKDSTFAGNSSRNGAAISIGFDNISITNSTFVGNTASGEAGAIFSDFGANYTLTNCTLTGNSANAGGGLYLIGGSFTLLNTIVAGNAANTAPDVFGPVNSQGHNLVGITDGSSGWIATDFTGTGTEPLNPLLGTLGYYGGTTETVPLLQGSLAAGDGATTGAPGTDQRGDSRDGVPDIGAAQLLDAVVTTTANSGPGTLRQAIIDTNLHPGLDYITFEIPGAGVHVINLASALPVITDSVVIDGYSQPGSSPNTLPAADNAVVDVEVNGGGVLASGLVLDDVSNSEISGLSLGGFGNGKQDVAAIELAGSGSGNSIVGNFIGVQANGLAALANTDGVIIDSGNNDDTVGGSDPADRNILSGNLSWGFIVEGNDNTIAGNLIGLDATGLNALRDGNGGVIDEGGSDNVVGGTTAAARNYIAGNKDRGVALTIDHTNAGDISGPNPAGNVIEGNWIGLNINGASAGGQDTAGVELLNASGNDVGAPGAGNVISGSDGQGVYLLGAGANDDVIQANFIGTAPSGASAVPNQSGGVLLDAGASDDLVGGGPSDGNVISGNIGEGVVLGAAAGSGDVVQYNFIGLNAAGTAAVGNAGDGIDVFGGDAVSILHDVIGGNSSNGVAFESGAGSGNIVQYSFIGLNATGTAAVGNGGDGIDLLGGDATRIGGPSEGNVISGNGGSGVLDSSPGSLTIQGNIIGLNAAGNARLGNGGHGIQIFSSGSVLIGGDAAGDRNVISGNGGHGIALNGSGTTILGNYIGTDATGTVSIGNLGSGIGLNQSSGNTIGDTSGSGGNVISGNRQAGIEFFDYSDGNFVVGNFVGTAADGVSPLGNGSRGILFDGGGSVFDTIGTLAANGGNVIAYNPVGIEIDAGTNDTISGDSIFGNTTTGILELSGANDSLAAPTITSLGSNTVNGTLIAVPDESYEIQVFATPEGEAPGQGKALIGVLDQAADGNGVLNFSVPVSSLAPGEVISATATDTSESDTGGDTSPFSQFLAVPLPLGSFRITPGVINTTAGQYVSFTVTALDTSGAVLTSYQGTVAFASIGTDSSPTLPGQYSFTAADDGSHTFRVRYTIAGAQTLGVVDVSNGALGLASVTVSPGAFDHLTIGGLSPNTPVGVQNSVTVQAVDAFGNVVNFPDRLHFTSNDTLAQLPTDATLVNGVGTFNVTFRGLLPTTMVNGQPARIYTVTVTDPSNHSATATQTVILPLYLLPAPVQFIQVENTAFTNQLVATFLSDLANGPALSPRDFTATIDWGDGTPLDQGTIRLMSDGTTFAVYGNHTYPTGQTDYPVDVTISFVPTGQTQGFSSQPVTPSVAAVLTAAQYAQFSDGTVVRAVGGQTSLAASSTGASANLTGANAGLKTTLFVASYANNPVPGSNVEGVSYYDLRATNTADGATLTVTFNFPSTGGISTLEYFNPSTGKFQPVVGSSLVPAVVTNGGHTITVTFDQTSFPQLSLLQGSVFTIVISPATATQSISTQPQVSLALPTGAGLTTTRDVTFQGSGVTVALTPSEDILQSTGRADLSGGGGDEQPSDDDLDLVLRILGFGPSDATPGSLSPAAAPPAKDPGPAGGTPKATGPGAWLLPPAPAEPTPAPADVLFAAAAEEPFAFVPHPAHEPFGPHAPQAETLLPGSGEQISGGHNLVAIPLLGAMAVQPPAGGREKRRRRTAGARS